MQGFSLPIEMTLHETAQGLRLHGNVVREFDELRKPVAIDIDNPTPEEAIRILQDYPGQLNDLTIRFTLEPGAKLQIDWGGIAYELTESGSIRIIEDVSRHTAIINDGEALICPRKSPEKFFDRSCGLRIVNGYGVLENLTLYPLNSIYK